MKGKFTVLTEAVQVKIKQLIVDGVLSGETRAETFRKISVVIRKYAEQTPKALRQSFTAQVAKNAVAAYNRFKRSVEETATANGITVLMLAALLRGERKAVETAERSGKPISEQVIDVERNVSRRLAEGGKEDYTEYIYPDKINTPDIRAKIKAELRRMSGEDGQLRNRAEMHVRHEAQQASIEEMRASGIKLVWASTHADSSKRCEPWQGRLYSLDGTYGEINGHSYEPLANATDVYVTTKAGKVWKNGLLGFGCRHRLIPYNDHQAPPKAFSAEEMERRRKLNEQQRAIERGIRRQKAEAWEILHVDGKRAQGLFRAAKANVEKYRAFCRKNNLVALPYRTQVMTEEMQNVE